MNYKSQDNFALLEIPKLIKDRMDILGLKATDLARETKISQSVISRLLTGKSTQMKLDAIYNILVFLELFPTKDKKGSVPQVSKKLKEISAENERLNKEIDMLRSQLSMAHELMTEYKQKSDAYKELINDMSQEKRKEDPKGFNPLNNRKISHLF